MKNRPPNKGPKPRHDSTGTGLAPAAPGHGRRRWFRLLALSSPLILLALAEAGLRLGDYGHPTSFFLQTVEHAVEHGEAFFIQNARFGWRFFPPALARSPQPVLLPAVKPPGTVRVFVLGESAAMGDPEPAYGFARQLQQLLQARHPDRSVQVVNVAMTAINSHVVREIAGDCAGKGGDCWVIYAGNNEVVGPFGAGTIFGRQAPGASFVRLNLALKQTRLGQLLSSIGQPKNQPAEWQGMEMFLEQQVERSDPRLGRVYENFERNLEAILDRAALAGAKVVVATVAVNLKDCPPFASRHRDDLSATQRKQWAKSFAAGRDAERESRYADALAAYERAAEIDPGHAELIFRRASCRLVVGQTNAAKADFALARDLDTLRFRADSRLNDIVRRTAAAKHVALLDAEADCARRSAGGVPGQELFYDHVHLNFGGNYWLATLLLPEVERVLFGPGSPTGNGPALDEQEVARRLAFTEFDQRRVFEEVRVRLQQPPFRSQSNFHERDAFWARRLTGLPAPPQASIPHYLPAISLAPGDWMLHANFGRLLEAANEQPAATVQWQEVARLLPHEPEAYFQLGNLAQDRGDYPAAYRLFHESINRRPGSTETLNGLGLVAHALGHSAEAKRWFEAALKLNPRFAAARINLAVLLASTGDVKAAKEQYAAVLRMDTNNVGARINLARLFSAEGRMAEALILYQEALKLETNNAVAHYNLGNALSTQKKYAEALTHYRAAVKAKPEFAEARYNLALELARLGSIAEALEHFAEAVRLQPGSADAHFNYGVALARQKRYADAAREFEETLKLQPQHPSAASLLERASILAKEGGPEPEN